MKFLLILFAAIMFGQGYRTDSLRLEKLKSSYNSKLESLGKDENSLFQKQKNADQSAKEYLQKKMDSVGNLWSGTYKNLIREELNFLKQNNHYKDAVNILDFYLTKQEATDFYADFEKVFQNLDKNLKESPDGRRFSQKFQNLMAAQPDKPAPEFVLKDINSQIFDLQKEKEKIILVDFWASWCEPCIKDLAALKKMQTNYGSKNFEIVAISRDENLESWRKSIVKNGVGNFIQISTVENKSDIENRYVITGIPVKFLINREGIIVKKWRGGSKENLKEIEVEIQKLLK